MTTHRWRAGFVMEQTLGHVTYTKNLQAALVGSARLAPVWMQVPFSGEGMLDRMPGVSANWTVRGSLHAYQALRARGGPRRFDALLFHTQTVALAAPLAARHVPVIISLDATPLNYDQVGAFYGHHARAGCRAERIKRALHAYIFRSASALTTWSEWAKQSLCGDYGIDPDHVTVIAPGVDLRLFSFRETARVPATDRPVRVLFVGGDFERKGGELLLECMRAGLASRCELHLVTPRSVAAAPGVFVHRDLGPNDPRLLSLYREADIFVLPTYADCLAVVLAEAMAAGLPVVTTTVGAQPEAVRDGRSGLLVAPGDSEALARALTRLIDDPALRQAMGQEGRAIAQARFDAGTNAERLADVIEGGIARWWRHRPLSGIGTLPKPLAG